MGNLQDFFTSTMGQIVTVSIILVLFILILISGKDKKTDIKVLAVSAILVALGTALGYVVLFKMPYGGTVTPFSLLAIVLAGYFFGVKRGVMVGMCVGMLNVLLNPYIIHPLQLLLDYPIAFGALGLGAIFRNKGKYAIFPTYWTGVIARYLCAVISGIIFFGSYAPEGFNAVTWSLFYNMTYLGAEALITTVLLCIPVIRNTFDKLKDQC